MSFQEAETDVREYLEFLANNQLIHIYGNHNWTTNPHFFTQWAKKIKPEEEPKKSIQDQVYDRIVELENTMREKNLAVTWVKPDESEYWFGWDKSYLKVLSGKVSPKTHESLAMDVTESPFEVQLQFLSLLELFVETGIEKTKEQKGLAESLLPVSKKVLDQLESL